MEATFTKADRRRRILLRAAAVLGLALTAALAWQGFVRSAIPGCGVDSACETVLNTRWSRVLGVPVGLLAAAVYIAVLAATAALPRQAARLVLGIGGSVLIAAAIWFGAVQAFILDVFCPLCMAAHGVGVLTGGLATAVGRTKMPVALVGVAAVAVLAGVQALQPEPAASVRQHIGFMDTGPGPERTVRFSLDAVGAQLQVHQTPHLGNPDAPAVLIEFFDYTCGFCRGMDGYLDDVRAAFGEDVAIVAIPVPLSGDCNPTLAGERGHVESCDLNRLALAVWQVGGSEAFAAFHEGVFEAGPDIAAARELAESLVSAEALDAALADPEIDAQLARNSELFSRIGGSLPQVIIGRVHVRGLPPGPEELIADVAEQFDLTPVQSPAAE